MRIYTKYQSRRILEDGRLEIVFTTDDYNSKLATDDLRTDKVYALNVSEAKSKRSLEQNKLLWKVIGDIADRDDSMGDKWDVYCQLLKLAKCKYKEYVVQDDEAIEILRGVCRAVEIVGTTEVKGRDFKVVKVYEGSSKFNTKEMTDLINSAMDYARELGLEYGEVFYE